MKRRALGFVGLGVLVAALGVGVEVIHRAHAAPVLTPSALLSLSLTDGSPGFLVSHRSSIGEVTELEVLRAADGSTLWREHVPPIQSMPENLAVSGGFIVMAGQVQGKGTALIAFDSSNGQRRWSTELGESTNALWIQGDVLIVETSAHDVFGYALSSGKALWNTHGIAAEYFPIFAGGFMIAPLAHAIVPPLRIVNLHTGTARDVGEGLDWPGAVVGEHYYAKYSPDGEGGALVTAELLAGGSVPDAGAPARVIVGKAGVISGSNLSAFLVELDLASGHAEPVKIGQETVGIPADCIRGSFFSLWRDRLLCDRHFGEALFARSWQKPGAPQELVPESNMRFWGGGATDWEWRQRDRWAFLGARSRFVPMVQNWHKSDDARLCVLDLENARLSWCAERPISNQVLETYGWLHIESHGDVHLIHLPIRKKESGDVGPLLVLDGNTGKFQSALELRAPALDGFPNFQNSPAPRSGDVLAIAQNGFFFGLDLAHSKLTFQRGPAPLVLSDAFAEVEALLGPVPK